MDDPSPSPTLPSPEEITERANDASQQLTYLFWAIVVLALLLAVLYPVLRTRVARRREESWSRPEAAPAGARVTSRMSWAVLLLFVPVLAVFEVGLIIGVGRSLVRGDPRAMFGDSASTALLVVGWCLAMLFLVLLSGALVWLLTYKVTITDQEVSTSAFFRTSRLRFADTGRITFVPERVRARRTSPAVLRFDAADRRGTATTTVATPRNVRITSGGGHFGRVLAVVDQWVHQRPELVADETTRELFESRGALTR